MSAINNDILHDHDRIVVTCYARHGCRCTKPNTPSPGNNLGGLAGAALGVAIGDKGNNETAGVLIGAAASVFAGATIGNQKDGRNEQEMRLRSGVYGNEISGYAHAVQTQIHGYRCSTIAKQRLSNGSFNIVPTQHRTCFLLRTNPIFTRRGAATSQRQTQHQQTALNTSVRHLAKWSSPPSSLVVPCVLMTYWE